MKVTIESRRTVSELLAELKHKYGSLSSLREHVAQHPRDVMAKVALHDWHEYVEDDPEKTIREVREIIIPDSAIDQLTVQRLQLLLVLKSLLGIAESTRALARAVDRDIKNVSEDVRVLNELGLVHVERAGRGRANRITLPGDQIELHLVEANA